MEQRLKRIAKILGITVVALLIMAALGVAGLGWGISSGCANTEQQRVLSPDGRREAVVFERDCGATTDYSTQVSVLTAGAALPNTPGNAYIYGHRTRLAVTWPSPTVVAIEYSSGARGLHEQARAGAVTVLYREAR